MTIGRIEARVGFGYDSHRMAEGRPLILGGVVVPYEKGLLGHSDADVICHAVIDALLGAAHMGDIGRLFPDSDNTYKDANSLRLLEHAAGLVLCEGWEISNIDATLVIEKPKIAALVKVMESNIATACGIVSGRVSIKPKTDEGMGDIGRGDAARAYAVCLLSSQIK